MIEQRFAAPASRRTVVKTGAKLAYVAPLVAASVRFGVNGAEAEERTYDAHDHDAYFGGKTKAEVQAIKADRSRDKVYLCHATCSDSNPFVLIEISASAADAHTTTHHTPGCGTADIVPAPVDSAGYAYCPGGVGPGATG